MNMLSHMTTSMPMSSCTRRNHFDCIHPDSDVVAGPLTYMDGWETIAVVIAMSDDHTDGTMLEPTIEYFEQHGCRDAHDVGMRDALLAAFGSAS